MGQCYGKNVSAAEDGDAGRHQDPQTSVNGGPRGGSPAPPTPQRKGRSGAATPVRSSASASAWPSPHPQGSASPLPDGISPSPARSTPRRFFRRPFPPPSPAKHIMAAIVKRQGPPKPKEGPIPEDGTGEVERPLDKSFGYGKNFGAKSSMMTTPISIEDVRREVKILKSLSGHKNLVKFYDACEDALNVYIVMELCEGGELLDRILSRGGRYLEEDAKAIVVQILSVVAFCHLQGVVHRDLKPENFLFATKDENSPMKLIDFGLSDFIKPDERLNDIVGSAYYVAPEVLHRSYSTEADIWSIGVIAYILLCGSRPFWARTESGIFRSVLRADPNFDDSPWPDVSCEAKDFVKRLLNKDYRKRMTAAQALTHPWLRDEQRQIPLDMLIFKLIKSYLRATPLKRAALKALMQNATEAMRESRVPDILNALEPLSYRWMDFEEFCAAAISPYHLEALEGWEQLASRAFEHFEREGNRVISVEELAQELNIPPTSYSFLKDWIRPEDGKLNVLGYTRYLHGVTIRSSNTRHR
ncbi:hypothetical protein C4D60_Mb07t22770 [Musa balbisiana]|uniref:Protein kinase domain-containing protein n=1 Tax=Musa balbisiana TaxID=52838 RepID=A0A4S8JIJ6_MUSBA|nr:hypothetical protein C4D60_Mb07t22770 [Musa balbisiana]